MKTNTTTAATKYFVVVVDDANQGTRIDSTHGRTMSAATKRAKECGGRVRKLTQDQIDAAY